MLARTAKNSSSLKIMAAKHFTHTQTHTNKNKTKKQRHARNSVSKVLDVTTKEL